MTSIFPKAHERLDAWRLAMELVDAVYRCTSSFPPSERFNLIDQMRRASCSIPNNIAEGAAKETARENLRALFYARGSMAELETQIEIARRRDYQIDDLIPRVERLSQVLNGYMRHVRKQL